MNRREALRTAAVVWIASSGVLAACARADERGVPSSGVLAHDEQDLIEEIADTLLPTTPSSAGAKAAGVGATINLLLTDCYKPEDQQRIVKGLAELRAACRSRQRSEFASLPREQREQFLREIDAEAKKAGTSHYFHLVRDLANTAYFSSEIGETKALRYLQTPGRWVGCVPLRPGQPAWG